MSENINLNNHEIIMENRKNINATGIEECIGFDDQTIVLKTKMGRLTVKGENLHINNYDTTNGNLSVDGKIIAIGYTAEENRKGFFGKLFR